MIIITISVTTAVSRNNDSIVIHIPDEISLQKNEITPLLDNLKIIESYQKLEIVFFYFSTGIERISYNGKNSISQVILDGGIKALLKFKNNNKLLKVLFIEAKGRGKKDILKKFREKINEL